jgi:hypothetical protein
VDGPQASGLHTQPEAQGLQERQGKEERQQSEPAIVASSATVPSATTTLNNRYAALLATFAAMNEEE